MADPTAVKAYLDQLNTSDRARASAWDAVAAPDAVTAKRLLDALPFSDAVRADLFDFRLGKTPTPSVAPSPASVPASGPEGSAVGRFVSGAWEYLNPVSIVSGLAQTVRHPLDTAEAMTQQMAQQRDQGRSLMQQGRTTEGVGHYMAGVVPFIGPPAVRAGEAIASGDVAGGMGQATGLLAPVLAKPIAQGVSKVLSKTGASNAAATMLEEGAASRVADVLKPEVGPNKTRFGNMGARVSGTLAKDLAAEGAPLSRGRFFDWIDAKFSEASQGLDAASDARNPKQVIYTKPILKALQAEVDKWTAQTHKIGTFKAGSSVVPGPNAARVAQIQQAMDEIAQLGPVANYEALRTIRASYGDVAAAGGRYSPSVTADFTKVKGAANGAADVASTLRETLAKMDPATDEANTAYSLYKTAKDVADAVRETERTRPKVGRAIMARLTGSVVGESAGGVKGAVAGYVLGPVVDSALRNGATTQLKTAAAMQRLATAIRSGNVAAVDSHVAQLRRLASVTGATAPKVTSPSESPTMSPTPIGVTP
jgi:hypothetical protein